MSLFWSEDYRNTRLFYFPTRLPNDELHTELPNFDGQFLYPYRKPCALAFKPADLAKADFSDLLFYEACD